MTITVRQAGIQDVPRLAPLFDEYRQYFRQPSKLGDSEQFLFERFSHLESVVFVAEEGDSLVGFAQLYPSFSSLTLERLWILNDFFIDEAFRDKGIGKRLIAAVKQFAVLTKSKGIELSAERENTRAWSFWERRGFVLDVELKHYFHGVEHESVD